MGEGPDRDISAQHEWETLMMEALEETFIFLVILIFGAFEWIWQHNYLQGPRVAGEAY